MNDNTILIVEDEKDLAELIAFNLEREGFKPVIALDGTTGLGVARTDRPALILLDLMLPGMLGGEVCRLLRQDSRTAAIPIIIMTAKNEEIDQVVGFELGADDYVTKPFSSRLLLLRIKAVLRRTVAGTKPADANVTIGPVVVDTERHQVFVDDMEVALTPTEYNLFLTLAGKKGKVQSREHLLKTVWGYTYTGDTRTVNSYITRLRDKLGAAGDMIKTVRGFGYKLDVA
jgi:two-component system, OmpR family, phosphate regulon response regulator PhoB